MAAGRLLASMLKLLLLGGAVLLALPGRAQTPARPPLTRADYQADFDYLWETVRDNYAYFDQKQTDWACVRATYRPQLDTLSSRRAFVRVLEQVLGELYDYHAGLGTNRLDSPRLVPTASDVVAAWQQGRALVLAVRPGYGAARVGVRPGMYVSAINGQPIDQAIAPLLPRCLRQPDPAARDFALNLALAGTHLGPRQLTLATAAGPRPVLPDEPLNLLENHPPAHLLTVAHYGQLGYIKINNSLGDNQLIAAFDSALTALHATRGLVLDLRDTPSGGNTAVARAIMGRFITREQPYQRHELPAEERATGIRHRWLELVSPRPHPYTAPLVVLAGRWTGSMGEGLTVGLAAVRQAPVVGTELARLHGAIYTYSLPRTGIRFNMPFERINLVSGLPREQYVPPVRLDPAGPLPAGPTTDAGLNTALQLLQAAKPVAPARPHSYPTIR